MLRRVAHAAMARVPSFAAAMAEPSAAWPGSKDAQPAPTTLAFSTPRRQTCVFWPGAFGVCARGCSLHCLSPRHDSGL